MSATNWPAAIAAVLREEGGYVNDPHDPGGETDFGISKRAYPDIDIKALTVAEAEAIYHRDYWAKIDGDALPAGLDLAVLDFAVNSGVARAVEMLQSLLLVTRDGVIGPKTLAAINRSDPSALAGQLCDVRLVYLHGLKNWPLYANGWTSRVNTIRVKALAMAALSHPKPAHQP